MTRPPFLVDSAEPERCWICKKRPAAPGLFRKRAGVCKECHAGRADDGAPLSRSWPSPLLLLLAVASLSIATIIRTELGYDQLAGVLIWWLVVFGIIVGIAIWVISTGIRSGMRRSRADMTTSVPPSVVTIPAGPGRFRITGVNRESRMDCVQIYEAIGPDNAKVKAELDGMVVTRIERV